MTMREGLIEIIADDETSATWKEHHVYSPDLEYAGWKSGYERWVLQLVRRINSTKTGSALLSALNSPVTILPVQSPTDIGADARTNVRGKEIEMTVGFRLVGRGRGSPSIIRFTPGTWSPGHPLYYKAGWWNARRFTQVSGDLPDEVLLHEIVHAVWASHGRVNTRPMGDGYDNLAEFIGVLLSNIYSSELLIRQ